MGVKRAIGGAEHRHSVGLCVKYKIQIQEYNNKCNSEGTVHVGMSMCMYIVKIQIHKYNDKYKSAGTVHVRRCAHHMASPPFALHKMKKTFDSFEVSENILQKDSSCKRGAGGTFLAALLFSFACARNLLRSSRACSQPVHLIKIIFNVDDRALRGKHLD